MATPHTCSGTDAEGKPCPCMRVKLKPDQELDEPAVCVNCGHWDTAHPIPHAPATEKFDITRLIQSYQPKSGGSALAPKVSAEAAVQETRQGFRRSQKSDDTDVDPFFKKKGKRKVRHLISTSYKLLGSPV